MKPLLPDDFTIKELDVAEVASWPRAIQIGGMLICSICILMVFYGLSINEKKSILDRYEYVQLDLKKDFEKKYAQSQNYAVYQQQKREIAEQLEKVLELLPKKVEVPGLVDAVSEKGIQAGLNFRSIRMRPETKSDFMTELPMEMSVVGSYHELATFVSLLAKMPRLVTVHDFSIGPLSDNERSGVFQSSNTEILRMILTAKTYRFVEESPTP
jgi:type IV pilus assembly protein PilO